MKNSVCIYIHWPWCESICKYCDYYKFKRDKNINYLNIYNCFIRDLKVLEKYFYDKAITSIHIGGGSPSIMNVELLRKLLEYIYNKYQITENLEVSIESNPEDILNKKLIEYKNIGINRLNLGVQSFSNSVLHFLGRNHDKKKAISSIFNSSNHFENTGIDLIYGLPGQDKNAFENQIIFARELPIKHISFYEFEYKNKIKNNFFSKKNKELLEEKKFFLYEINSFSIKGYQSQYNISVLGMNNYIGIGPSAHGRILKENNYIKVRNSKILKEWSNPKINPYKKRILSKTNALEEFLLLGLSKSEGIYIKKLEELTNYETSKYINFKNIAALKEKKLIFEESGRLFLNHKGMFLINSIISNLLVAS